MMTNTPPNGAFRGFGAPQTQFAVEVHMDRIADALGLDPVQFRDQNALRPGDTTATGQKLGADCSVRARYLASEAVKRHGLCETAQGAGGHESRHRAVAVLPRLRLHGIGRGGLASKASLSLTQAGVRILVASTEIGQGTRTMHAQIVADTLGVPFDQVDVAVPDTARVPDSGPTVASRTCMVVGRILARCAIEMKERLAGLAPAEHFRRHGQTLITKQYEPPPGIVWNDELYRGDAYATYSWACDVAEVEFDPGDLGAAARRS